MDFDGPVDAEMSGELLPVSCVFVPASPAVDSTTDKSKTSVEVVGSQTVVHSIHLSSTVVDQALSGLRGVEISGRFSGIADRVCSFLTVRQPVFQPLLLCKDAKSVLMPLNDRFVGPLVTMAPLVAAAVFILVNASPDRRGALMAACAMAALVLVSRWSAAPKGSSPVTTLIVATLMAAGVFVLLEWLRAIASMPSRWSTPSQGTPPQTRRLIDKTMKRASWDDLTPDEMASVAEAFRYGRFCRMPDAPRAESLYERAAALGSGRAMIGLAMMKLEVHGDAPAAIALLLRALGSGHVDALLTIAHVYERGSYPRHHPDRVMAKRVYEAALQNPVLAPRARVKLADLQAGGLHLADDITAVSRPLPTGDVVRMLRANFETPMHPAMHAMFHATETPPEHPTRLTDPHRNALDPVTRIIVDAPAQRVREDRQNTHDTAALNSVSGFVDRLRSGADSFPPWEIARRELLQHAAGCGVGDRDAVVRVLDAMTDNEHSRLGISERELLARTWGRIQDPANAHQADNLRDNLVISLTSGVEDGAVVCSTGRAMRIPAVFDGVEGVTESLSIKPSWAIDEELATAAAKVREDVLRDATSPERDAYEKMDPDETEAVLCTEVAARMEAKLREESGAAYVKTGLLTEESLDARLEPLVQEF